jgi:hypothetical protein
MASFTWLLEGMVVMVSDVAIVHTGRDREVAARIASFFRRHGLDVWIDPEPLVLGRTPIDSVLEVATTSRLVLYLLSPAVLEQPWVSFESRVIRDNVSDNRLRQRIIPVIVEPVAIPSYLHHILHFNLTKGDFEEQVLKLANDVQKILKKRTVFICHSSRDKSQVEQLVRALRRRPRLAVWYDETSLKPGSIIRRGIEAGIAEADYLVAVLSSHAIDTIEGWIGFELDQAYERERQRNLKGHYFVIPVLIESDLDVPSWLSTKVYVDLTRGFDSGVRSIVDALSADLPAE